MGTALLFQFLTHLVRNNDPPQLTATPETNPAQALHFGLWLANYPLDMMNLATVSYLNHEKLV